MCNVLPAPITCCMSVTTENTGTMCLARVLAPNELYTLSAFNVSCPPVLMHEPLVSSILWGAVAPQSTFTIIHDWHAGAPQRCSVQLQQVPGTLSPMQKADAPHVYTPQYRLLLVQSLKTGFPRLTNCIFRSKPFFFYHPVVVSCLHHSHTKSCPGEHFSGIWDPWHK